MKRVLFLLASAYILIYVWPGRWRYDHLGGTPIRTERVTGRMQFANLHGWQWQLPPIGGDPDDVPYKAPAAYNRAPRAVKNRSDSWLCEHVSVFFCPVFPRLEPTPTPTPLVRRMALD